MILATRDGHNVQARDLFSGNDRIPRPSEFYGWWTQAGKLVSVESASGLPAVMAAIRLVSETIGTLPLCVNRDGDNGPQAATDAWQWGLLHDQPDEYVTPYQAWTYASASREGWGGAFLLKGKAQIRADRRVVFLKALSPSRVVPKVVNGELVFAVTPEGGGAPQTVTRADVLYVPGVLFDHPLIGCSPIHVHRQMLGGASALEEYGNRFYANDATPGVALIAGENTSPDQRKTAKESWQAAHRGNAMSHGTAVLPSGWTVERVGVSPQDAQYVEGQRWNLEQTARAFRVPAWMLGASDPNPGATPERKNMEFLQFSLQPRLAAIEQALHADPDLFPDKGLRPRFDADELLRVDFATRAGADLRLRQAGIATVNELRGHYGLGPHPDGDELQATPVGGAPNDRGTTTPASPDDPADEAE